jgi:SAM-dependent methyltransferase
MAGDARASFASSPAAYAADRPLYPEALFEWIAERCGRRRTAWDCATGNGQAAIGLARRFHRVEATDLSPEQVTRGFAAPNVRYSAQPAEATDFPAGSFDLVAVAQALHWFDYERFWPEVRRVAAPGAFFCAWGYSWFQRTVETETLHNAFLDPLVDLLDPYWAPNNRILWDGYRSEDVRFPFERVEAPHFEIRLDWDAERLIAYVRTWSAWKLAQADPAAHALSELEALARDRFSGHGALGLSLPLFVAAGPGA